MLFDACYIFEECLVADDVVWKVVVVRVSLDGFTAMFLDQCATGGTSGELPVNTINDIEEDGG